MNALSPVPDLRLPEAQILLQAQGSPAAALKLTAAFGYRLACQDLDQVCETLRKPLEVTP